jgi:hypothetical protein
MTFRRSAASETVEITPPTLFSTTGRLKTLLSDDAQPAMNGMITMPSRRKFMVSPLDVTIRRSPAVKV